MLDLHLDKLIKEYPLLKNIRYDIKEAFSIIKDSFIKNNTLFLCGNGGSASDSEHIAGELLKSFLISRKVTNSDFKSTIVKKFGNSGNEIIERLQEGLRTISLTSHPAFITAFANDVDPEYIFAQQLYVLAKSGDVLFGLSTSGNAKNVYKAFQVAAGLNLKTILLTGENGGRCLELADVAIKVPLKETYKIQEYHLPIYHSLCIMLEEYFYGSR